MAERLGLSEAEVAALDQFEQHPGFSHRERLALRYADKLIYEARSDLGELYRELQAEFDPAELVELGTLIGLNIGMIGHLVHSWEL